MKIWRQNSVTKKNRWKWPKEFRTIPCNANRPKFLMSVFSVTALHRNYHSLSTDCDQEVRYKVVTCYDWWEDNRQTRTIICSLSLMTETLSPGNGWFRFDLKLLMWMKLTQKHSNHGFSDSKLPEIDLHPFFPTLPVKWETARKRAVVFSHVKSKASDQNYRFYLN